MSDTDPPLKKYQLIKFIDSEDENGLINIDGVPCQWVRYDNMKGQTVAKFPPPPYDDPKKMKLLNQLIKTQSSPLPSWPEYSVELRGHANTYEEYVERLRILEKQPFAFSSDPDTVPSKKVLKISEQLQKKSLEAIIEVPRMESDDSSNLSDDQGSHSSSEDSWIARPCKKFPKGQPTNKKKSQKKGAPKLPIRYSISTRSHVTSKESKKANIPLKKSHKQAVRVKIPSNRISESLDNLIPSTLVSNVDYSTEGTYVIQVSGELEREVLHEQRSSPKQNKNATDCSQESKKANIPPEKSREQAVQVKILSNRISESSDNLIPSTLVSNVDYSAEGTYVIQASGKLESEVLHEQRSSPEQNENATDCSQAFPMENTKQVERPQLRKPSNFNQSLAKAEEILQKAEKNYTKDTLLIISTLKGLSIDLNENTNAINNLCAAVQSSIVPPVGHAKPTALVLQSNFELPFHTLDQFKEFDSQLRNAKYRQDCIASLLFYIDPDNHVSKSVTNIIKKFIGREVALNFTAVKQMKNKELFKNTQFCTVMFEVVTKHHTDNQGNPIAEKYFFQCVGHSLANAKDWDGFREQRIKKKKADEGVD